MEMLAWIEGLNAVYTVHGACEILVYSDSEYVGLGVRKPGRMRHANTDLWPRLDEVVALHSYVEFVHVKGHGDSLYNIRVDKLAGDTRREGRKHGSLHSDEGPSITRPRTPVAVEGSVHHPELELHPERDEWGICYRH